MGRGNVCVLGKCEGLYYIDNDDLCVYRPIGSTAAEEMCIRDRHQGHRLHHFARDALHSSCYRHTRQRVSEHYAA